MIKKTFAILFVLISIPSRGQNLEPIFNSSVAKKDAVHDVKSKISALSRKENILLRECVTKHSLTRFDNFEFSYRPKANPSDPFSSMRIDLNWNKYYGSQVVVFILNSGNDRFGDVKTIEHICGWGGDDYRMLYSTSSLAN